MAVDKRHVAVFTPDPSVHEGFEARGLDGARVVIPDLVEYTDDNGLLTVVLQCIIMARMVFLSMLMMCMSHQELPKPRKQYSPLPTGTKKL